VSGQFYAIVQCVTVCRYVLMVSGQSLHSIPLFTTGSPHVYNE